MATGQGQQGGQQGQQNQVYALQCVFDSSWSESRIEQFRQQLQQQAKQLAGGNEVEFAISQVPLNTRQ